MRCITDSEIDGDVRRIAVDRALNLARPTAHTGGLTRSIPELRKNG